MKNISVSVLIPAYNEKENIPYLVQEIDEFVKKFSLQNWEFILIDDGSTDNTYQEFKEYEKERSYLSSIRILRNQGKTKALDTGLVHSKGEILVIFDADLQFTFEDAKKLVDKILEGYDVAAGKKIGKYEKKFISGVYNFLARLLFGVPVSDMNAMKSFKREVLEVIPLRKDWHRYIIPWAWEKGFTITEIPVILRPRERGKSKYTGWGRIIIGFIDLLSVKFQITFMRKPLVFFGTLGLLSLFSGFIIGIVALYIRFIYNQGYRPILYLIILLILVGLLLFTLGFLAESQAGVYDRLEKIERILKERKER